MTTLRPEKVGLAKPKSQRPPLGPLTNETRELERKSHRTKRDYVLENKLRVLKENMKRSGNADIADLAEYGVQEETGTNSLRASKDYAKHHDLAEFNNMLPKN